MSRILIFPHPGSQISDPGSRIKRQEQNRGVKKICCHTIFCSHKFHNIVNYFISEMLKKKFCANFQRIINFLLKKLSLSSQKYGFGIRDPGSGIRKKPIPDPRSRIQGSKRPRIPDPDRQHCPQPRTAVYHLTPPATLYTGVIFTVLPLMARKLDQLISVQQLLITPLHLDFHTTSLWLRTGETTDPVI